VPFGMVLAFNGEKVWGVRRPEGYKGYELVAWPNTPFAADKERGPDIHKMRPGEGLETGEIWTKTLDMRPRSLVHAGEILVLGGGPYVVAERDPFAAYEGRTDGLIRMVRTQDGELIAQHELDSPVVWNGLAVAGNRLYAATMDGHVVCLAQ
jgi:outer membrane protein assembly factor BamB